MPNMIYGHTQYMTKEDPLDPSTYKEEESLQDLLQKKLNAINDSVDKDTESAFDVQVGGGHYKRYEIQPVEFIQKNKLGFCEGNVVKYICRWQFKDGLKDLEKAKHYIDLLIEMEKNK